MSSVTRHALRVYSALSSLKGSGDDILDALIPFFEPVLEIMNGKIFDPRLFAVGSAKALSVEIYYGYRGTFHTSTSRQGIFDPPRRESRKGRLHSPIHVSSAVYGESADLGGTKTNCRRIC
jgi:hypothetical protein